jgi:hypothetical protein
MGPGLNCEQNVQPQLLGNAGNPGKGTPTGRRRSQELNVRSQEQDGAGENRSNANQCVGARGGGCTRVRLRCGRGWAPHGVPRETR